MTKRKLLRKAIVTSLVVVMLLLSYIPIAAEEEVIMPFITRDIYLNGVLVKNYELNYPLVTKDDTTYVPLTKDMGDALGFQVLIDQEQMIIQILKTEPSFNTIKNSDLACNLINQIGLYGYDYVVAAVTEYDTK